MSSSSSTFCVVAVWGYHPWDAMPQQPVSDPGAGSVTALPGFDSEWAL